MPRLTPENTQRARDLIALYPRARSALIPILHVAQEQDGYLTPRRWSTWPSCSTSTAAEVRGTATFYDMLFTEPVGRYLVSVCTNIACMLCGAYELLEHAEEHLGVPAGGTTEDRMITLEEVECIALCGNAPCLTVNWRFFGDVTNDRFDQLISDLREGRLGETVPPHGTLCRVRRSVGLPGEAPAEARATDQPAGTVATAAGAAPAPAAGKGGTTGAASPASSPSPMGTASPAGSPRPGSGTGPTGDDREERRT